MPTSIDEENPSIQAYREQNGDMKGANETELAGLMAPWPRSPREPVAEAVGRALQETAPSTTGQASELDIEASERPRESSSAASPKVEKGMPTCLGIPMNYMSLFLLTAVQTVGPLQTAWTRKQNIAVGGPRYLNSSIILFAECVKVVASFILLSFEEDGPANAAKSVHRQLTENLFETMKIAVPALLYAVQGNLLYYGMDKLSPPVYTVTYQLKILTTALLSVIMLGKKIGCIKWTALVLLTVGVSMVQLQGSGGNSDPSSHTTTTTLVSEDAQVAQMGNAVKGLIAILAACCTSGLAGVYLEKMLTQTSASIWMRNVQLGAVGACMAMLTAVGKDSGKLIEGGFAQGFTQREFCLVLTHSLGGLLSAAVLKYAGNILKCFAAAISVVLISCIAAFMTDFSADWLFEGGVSLVIGAVFLYNVGMPTFVEDAWLSFWADASKNNVISEVMSIVPLSNTAGSTHTS